MLKIGLLAFLVFFVNTANSQNLKGGGEVYPDLLTNQESLQKWRDLRFGLFIHWGPVALRGTEIGWSRGREVPYDDYDSLYKEFNPVLFDADEWVAIAKSAGMKYLILVTKHHDGFTLWDSDATDYDIMNSPFKRDIVKEIARACKREGILFGTYYSILDWYHPDYPVLFNRRTTKPNAVMARYLPFLKQQLRELVIDYGTEILWFDGEWEEPWQHDMGMELYAWARGLNNQLLINNRVDKGRAGMAGVSESDRFAGDFETPEQRVGNYNPVTPWETCMTICRQWAWKPNDKLKSLQECIHTLVRTVGGDGNLLLNVGPMPDGRFEQRQIDRLREIGDWLKLYGETVYGTRGGPIPPQHWGVTTRKDDRVFLHVLDTESDVIVLPNWHNPVKSAVLFLDQSEVRTEKTDMGLLIRVPEGLGEELDIIIELTI